VVSWPRLGERVEKSIVGGAKVGRAPHSGTKSVVTAEKRIGGIGRRLLRFRSRESQKRDGLNFVNEAFQKIQRKKRLERSVRRTS
jgi:hypothetical protein